MITKYIIAHGLTLYKGLDRVGRPVYVSAMDSETVALFATYEEARGVADDLEQLNEVAHVVVKLQEVHR